MNEMDEDNRIARQPTSDDPSDFRIMKELKRFLLATEKSREIIGLMSDEQADFFEYALGNLDNSEGILSRYKELLVKLASISKATIESGEEHLREVEGRGGLIVVINHLGIAKLTQYPTSGKDEPFPIRHASTSVIASRLNANLHETALQLPSPLSEVQEACQVITVPASGVNRTELLKEKVNSLRQKESNAVIVMYPEGGTSGKRNESGPYGLEEFHSGAFVVAAQTGTPVLPICQYFNPESGFELHILEPLFPDEIYLDQVGSVTQDVRASMQDKLDSLTSSK